MSKRAKGIILVIDDDPLVVSMVTVILENKGYQVRSARDGQQAIEIASKTCPELVLLDITLPRMDGYSIAAELRSRLGSGVPIVALSALPRKDSKRMGEVGMTGWIGKPFEVPDLLTAVETYLATASSTSESATVQ